MRKGSFGGTFVPFFLAVFSFTCNTQASQAWLRLCLRCLRMENLLSSLFVFHISRFGEHTSLPRAHSRAHTFLPQPNEALYTEHLTASIHTRTRTCTPLHLSGCWSRVSHQCQPVFVLCKTLFLEVHTTCTNIPHFSNHDNQIIITIIHLLTATDFLFYVRLTFSHELVEDGREKASYDVAAGTLTVHVPKLNKGIKNSSS